MNAELRLAIARRVVILASALVPAGQRDAWRHEWHGELAALRDVPLRYRRPVRRAFGAFADAFWLRQRSVADFDWIDDVRQGGRQIVLRPGFAATAVAILAVGIAATVTMFSVTDQILLRPLPYPSSERIVTVWETRAPSRDALEVAPGNLLDWRKRARSFEHFAAVEPYVVDVLSNGRPESWRSSRVTEGFFESFEVVPLLGRLFEPGDYAAGQAQVLVIGEAFWRQRFAGDPAVIGTAIRTEDGQFTIIGVVPASFEPRLLGTDTGQRTVWQPKALLPREKNIRGSGYWNAVGRLRNGVDMATAQAELDAVSAQLAREYPRTNDKTGARVMPLREHLVGDVVLGLRLLAGATFIVLLISCVNVANLLLARGAARTREMVVRTALGARRSRLVRQLLLESVVIALLGGLLGGALATGALATISRLGPPSVPWIDTLHLDWRAMAFAALVSALVALLAGLLPAFRAARTSLAAAGRATATADPSQHRWRAGLVIAEVALALVLTVGAGLLIRSFVGLMQVDPGFDRDRVLVAQVFVYGNNPSPAQQRTFLESVIERVSRLPAVQHAGVVSAMPFSESNINIDGAFAIEGRPPSKEEETARTSMSVATPGYFAAMRMPVKAGRLLDERDGVDSARVTVITESMARRHWRDVDDAIGDRISFRFTGQPITAEIVGVVGSLRHDTLDQGARDELFIPLAQRPFGSMTFVVRSATDAAGLFEPVREAIWAVNPDQPISSMATLDGLVQRTVTPRRFALAIIVGFAGIALLLSIAGVYSVLNATMAARLREFGLRVALGAKRGDIVRLVLRHGAAIAGVGLTIGLAGALGASQLLRSFLFGIGPADPIALGAAIILMTVAALAACYLPARRAATADPVSVLRSE